MKALLISLVLCSSSYCLSQETTQAILTPNTPWVKEIIQFPTPWAPKLTVQGFEELRFAPGWKNPESDGFWTLVMSWNIDTQEPITARTIEHYLESYYDGLMSPNRWATTFPPPNALFQESTTANKYQGKIKLFDGFHTGAIMTMHVLAEVTYCPNTHRSILLFRISTQEVGTPIWEELQAITLLPTVCD